MFSEDTTMTNHKTSVTITMDNNKNHNNNNNNNSKKNGKRKGSWDSKVKMVGRRSETPSSILSSDSDIRFTRKVSGQYRCGCCVLAAFITFLLVVSIGVYLGYTFLSVDPGEDRIFRGSFRVSRGDSFSPPLADPSTLQFRERSRNYRERLNVLFRRSPVRTGFVGTEVLALDGVEGEDLVVHFNLRFDARYGADVAVSDLLRIMHTVTINATAAPILDGLQVDPTSLLFREEGDPPGAFRASTTPATTTTTTEPPPPRRCAPVGLDYCRRGLPYNATSYPNVLGHKDLAALREDVIAFRELVDAECHRLAFEFVCRALQPECVARASKAGVVRGTARQAVQDAVEEDAMVPPCRSFCKDFMAGCGSRVPQRFREALQCTRFPEYAGPGSCADRPGVVAEVTDAATPAVTAATTPRAAATPSGTASGPACVEVLRAGPHAARVCDGVPDCADMADELDCGYCPRGAMHCGLGAHKHCVHPHQRCDAKQDCPGGADEKHCLSVAPRLGALGAQGRHLSPVRYHAEGYVVFNEKGETGKLCTENLNATVPAPNREATLSTIATSLCAALSYQKVETVRVQLDEERTERYVLMEDPTATEITFVPAPCPRREVLYVACSQIECGVRAAAPSASRLAASGDWPWHAALFKDGAHVCDATLLSAQWLLTTSSCFQGSGDAGDASEWAVRVGAVRLSSRSPWQQERAALVHRRLESPVEGSMLTLLRVSEPFVLSDAVRPICLPDAAAPQPGAQCTALGWGGKAAKREALRRVDVRVTNKERCENVTIPSTNALCADKHNDDCEAEELAGSPLVCLHGRSWTLAGVSSWRVACSKTPSAERPRMYDKVSSNLEWIRRAMREAGEEAPTPSRPH
ncbi:atrial natriuretic peptide-converting enzyme [Thrips palmi]|uniref:Atrial natriuretic peptide-converting enzyme n=1 Tax=Thrips palmi TaxID=161013 RepID=A0A6P8Z0A5_THRPL|nr:atrial natriuretic peptide-converting enzyme [Thrips palmi]